MAKERTGSATTAVIDQWVGSVDIGAALGVSTEYALRLMRSGEFGELVDVGSGEHRARPRVRKSAVDRWLSNRIVKAAV